jgi:hypothetical protein
LFEFLSEQGYRLYQLDGVWIAEPAGSDDIVNALIAAYQPPVSARMIPTLTLWRRVPVDVRIAIRGSSDLLVAEWLRLIDDPRLTEVDLDDPELIGAMTYMVGIGILTEEQAEFLRQ